jgi:hypothetical protein
MEIHLTPKDIEQADRLMQNPFDSDRVWHTIYRDSVSSDDGLFNYRGEYVPCFGCQPDPMSGEGTWAHGHIVIEGSNGGVRCEPLTDESFGRFVRDVRYPVPENTAIRVLDDADRRVILITDCRFAVQVSLAVSQVAKEVLARDGIDALGRLIALGLLFDSDADDS